MAQADRSAEVVDHEHEIPELQRLDQPRQIRGVIRGTIAPFPRLFGEPEAQVVRCDHAVVACEIADQISVQEGPRGRAVDHEHDGTFTLVHVVHPTAIDVDEVRLERVQCGIQPCRAPHDHLAGSGAAVPAGANR